MIISNIDELLQYIDDDNNSYLLMSFSKDFDYAAMIEYLLDHQDNYKCALFLANCYKNGLGVNVDKQKSFEIYEKFAKKGIAKAQNSLGNCYHQGIGVAQDSIEGAKWYRLAALQGNAFAQNNLGMRYLKGDGVEKDLNEALKWFEKAALQGNAFAQNNLGNFYIFGLVIKKDYNEAFKWFEKAAIQGADIAQNTLGVSYYFGRGIEQDYNEAFKWFEKAAIKGNYKAQNSLGNCYFYGHGVEKNYDEAFKYFKKSAEKGFNKAYFALGNCYYYGYGTNKDLNEALKYYKKAYVLGYTSIKDKINEIEEEIIKNNIEELNIPNNIDIFISWNHKNEKDKNNIKDYLEEKGYYIWESDSSASGDLNLAVREAIKRAKGYIILLSHQAFESNYIPTEIDMIFDSLEEKGIKDKENIKIYVIKDDDNSVDDIINELNSQNNSFSKLVPLTVDFNYDENNLNGLLKFVKKTVMNELFRQYRNLQRNNFDSFPVSLSDIINKYDDETIIASLTFEDGYINRDLYTISNERFDSKSLLKYNDKPIMIYGVGGTGKSLYLKNLIRVNLDKSKLFFYLPCSSIKKEIDKCNNFMDVICYICLNDHKYNILKDQLTNIFLNEKIDFYFIIDAIDEAMDKSKKIVDLAMDFYKNNKKIHLIFTTRNNTDYQLILNNNIEPLILELRGMSSDDISKLFDNMLKRQKNDESKNVINRFDNISKDAFMQALDILSGDIKKNPLLISNLIYIYFVTNKLYSHKYEIIDKSKELLIDALESERSIETDIFDKVGLTPEELLPKLAYDLCVKDEIDIIKRFEQYIKDRNKDINNVDVEKYAKELKKYLQARKIITGNTISHEIYRSYFAATYLYNLVYTKNEDEFGDTFIDLDKEKLIKIIYKFLNKGDGLWPTVTDDLICKLDFEVHFISKTIDERNPLFNTFNDSLIEMLKNDGISAEAYNGLEDIINKKILYFYEFILKYMNR